MSGTQWAKMCHQAGLVDSAGAPLTSVDADLVYVDVQRREFEVKGMKFPFEVFAQEAVPALAEKAGLSVHAVISRLAALEQNLSSGTRPTLTDSSGPRGRGSSAPEAESAGPARLYYEHRRRSSSQGRRNFRRRSEAAVMEAQPSAGTLDLSQICDRTAADVRGSKKEKSYVPGMTTHSVLISNRLSQSTRNLKTPDRRSGSVSTASLQGSRSEMVGPERFYYDTKSYTGTAKRSLGAPPLDKSHAGSSLEGIGEVTEEETKGMLMDRRQVAQGRPDRVAHGNPRPTGEEGTASFPLDGLPSYPTTSGVLPCPVCWWPHIVAAEGTA
ncbi:hypothetical protein Pmar_PMAR026522 [Perkinsus marinus ATCC 50983]|uniref:Uncharacterized protein n=1 Tax=Perkinsus marinus (strain ATCC 50983 / TXsc) TaxID=423536 RepID=C5LDS4_PERM5|nr:hypothetical protein Pmar_PMAR026522 [Perkinsus marinus ATCC 50983]EER05088.1 hypothetical protein Pmar_PMAR026522 [Perkinsus marinus ATCC 50983]|eukprot:XP_002773272.1 hypothetical protein Pmar_PMAR026522 [Perkinsus marinus ATCC 50983]